MKCDADSTRFVLYNIQSYNRILTIRSGLIVTAGVAGVSGVSWILTTLNVTAVISFDTNSQITGRISPRLIDLYAALASGAAGAFAMSREDIADSLPGVAISISLVPPVCVVGVGLSEGDLGDTLNRQINLNLIVVPSEQEFYETVPD